MSARRILHEIEWCEGENPRAGTYRFLMVCWTCRSTRFCDGIKARAFLREHEGRSHILEMVERFVPTPEYLEAMRTGTGIEAFGRVEESERTIEGAQNNRSNVTGSSGVGAGERNGSQHPGRVSRVGMEG